LAGGEEFLSKDKGESLDEVCTRGTVDMVFGCCIHWYVFSVIGSLCMLTTGLIFNINEQQRVVKLLQPGIITEIDYYCDDASPIAVHIDLGEPAIV